MDCEACTDRMVELLYGGLPAADAEAARTHLARCDACTETYGRVSTGHQLASMLELVDPPVSVLDSVIAAARQKAAHIAHAPEEPAAPVHRATLPREDEERGSALASFLQWVGGHAMRPQMAMAMTLLLMVGLGMWYVPTLHQSDPADSHAIVNPAPGDEVGPSASLAPADPLDLEADPATGRILPRDDVAPAARSAERHRRPQREVGEPEPRSTELTEATEPQELAIADEPAAPRSPAPSEVLEEPLPDPRLADTLDGIAPGQALALTGHAVRRPPVRPRTGGATQRATTQTSPMPSPAPQPALPRTASATQRYERGMRRLRHHDYRGAEDDFESVVVRPDTDARRLLPSALHQLARSQSASNNCRGAVRTYERLLGQHRHYSGAPEAMIEAAVCYRRLGRISDSRRLLERARTSPSVAARARRELVDLGERERAMDRGTLPAERAEPVQAAEAHE